MKPKPRYFADSQTVREARAAIRDETSSRFLTSKQWGVSETALRQVADEGLVVLHSDGTGAVRFAKVGA